LPPKVEEYNEPIDLRRGRTSVHTQPHGLDEYERPITGVEHEPGGQHDQEWKKKKRPLVGKRLM